MAQTFSFPSKYESFLQERLQVNDQGQLLIIRPFDYELFQTVTFQFHCLILEQQNGMNLTRVNKTEEIQVMIDDVNDEPPQWMMDEPYQYGTYFGYVEKDARPETSVFRFKASDPDTTSKLTYELVHGDKNLFHLSPDGTLTTYSNQKLQSPTYNLSVRAVDLNSQKLSTSRSVEAHLLVRTDRFEPKFFREKYVFNVSEYTQPSTIIGSIRAKSYSTTNEYLRYFLQQPISGGTQTFVQSSGSGGDMYEFKIDETQGSIKILKMLRYSDHHNNNTKHFTGRFHRKISLQIDHLLFFRYCQRIERLANAITCRNRHSHNRYQRQSADFQTNLLHSADCRRLSTQYAYYQFHRHR